MFEGGENIDKDRFPNVFLDMDGVLTNFGKQLEIHFGVENRSELEEYRGNLKESKKSMLYGTDFYYQLDKFDMADEIIDLACSFSGSYSLLTKAFTEDVENSSTHKLRWIKKHLSDIPPKEVIITPEKYKYATSTVEGVEKPNLLIDDLEENCVKFRAAGGIAIEHFSSRDSFNSLKEKFFKVYS